MKSGITRWKIRPSKKGLPVTVWPLLGSVHGFLPVARPTKLATVIGTWSPNRVQWMVPWLVSKVATSGPEPGRALVYSARSAATGGRPPAGAGRPRAPPAGGGRAPRGTPPGPAAGKGGVRGTRP